MATGSSGYEILNCDVSMYDGAGFSTVGSGSGGISTSGMGGSYKPLTWTTSSYEIRGGVGGNTRGNRSQYVYFDDVIDNGFVKYNYESPTVSIDFGELNLDFEKWMTKQYGKPKNEYEVELI